MRDIGNNPHRNGDAPASRGGPFPLSPAQWRLWFLDRLAPGSPLYNIPVRYRLKGNLDYEVLERTLTEIVRRHETLRTVFPAIMGDPRQVIKEPTAFQLKTIDLTTAPSVEREQKAHELVAEESKRPFDLAEGPLMRAVLFRLADDDHILIVTMHHIISDGWSMEVFADEVGKLYTSFVTGWRPDLPELPIQYTDYTIDQHEWLRDERAREEIVYWKKKLRGMHPAIDLPADRQRPSVLSFRGFTRDVTIPEALSSTVRTFSRREGVTPFIPFVTAFAILLSRYTGLDDIAVGTVATGRNRSELERMIGFFVNTLVLRIDLSGDPSFGELFGRVRETTMEALAHHRTPFDALVDELRPDRDPSRSPLFQAMFAYQNMHSPPPVMPGITASARELYTDTSKFDLLLSLGPEGDGFAGALEYSTDLFDSPRMERLLHHYESILGSGIADPERRISALPMLSNIERHRLFVEWNDTRREMPVDGFIHELFEEQAGIAHDAVAVTFGEEHLTYGALEERSGRLADYLNARGVVSESLVGICVDKSPLMVTGLLGIMRAGGAYVPLDPDDPPQRLALMCRDARIGTVLTERRHRQILDRSMREDGPDAFEPEIISLDDEWQSMADTEWNESRPACTDGNAAYMIYTSGSTGTPKGALNVHGGLKNQIHWYRRAMEIEPGDRIVFETRLSFDLSVVEVWPALIKGASIHIPGPNVSMQPHRLLEWMIAEQITHCSFATPLADALIHEPLPESMPLERLMTGGDLLHRGPPRELPFLFMNSYGPTENSVVTTWDPDPIPVGAERPPPIGIPIDNNRVYTLDRHFNPVPIGVPGELCIGGIGLARGYYNRPGFTAERFVPDPFGDAGGERLYRSGDLTRFLEDGNIEFLGRFDHQIKIRGFRIELGEIEAVLKTHPDLKEAAVKKWEHPSRGAYIAAYVASGTSTAPTTSELRNYLRARLPEYMVPADIMILDSLPLSPNNKIDRAALPEPAGPRPDREKDYVPPRTDAEKAIAAVWRDLLGLESVGIHDNFFDIGGHSLLLARVNAKLNQMYDREISMVEMFRHPTISSLVDYLRHEGPTSAAPAVTDERVSKRERLLEERRRFRQERMESSGNGGIIEDRYRLSPMQQGMLFHSIIGTQPGVYIQQVICTLKEAVDTKALREAIRLVGERHTALRTRFNLTDPAEPHQEVYRSVDIPYTEKDRRAAGHGDEEELERFCTEDRLRGFDLSDVPLQRYTLVRTAEREYHLVWTFHHALLDGRSIFIILREIFDIYDSITLGEHLQLDEPVPYRRYIDWLAANVIDRAETYWKDRLNGFTAPTPLPTAAAAIAPERRAPAEVAHGRCERRLPHGLTDALSAFATECGVTLNTVVQGAWALMLGRYAGVDDVAFGAIRACRHIPIPGASSVVGVLINTLPVRIAVPRDEMLLPWLETLRSRWISIREFEHTPLVTIQRWSDVPAGEQLFSSLFAFENYRFGDALRAERPTWRNRSIRHTVDTNYPLTFLAFAGRQLLLHIEYDRTLYTKESADRLLARLETILAGMATDPERRLSDLPMLTAEERRLVLVDWNRTAVPYPKGRCVHEIFAERAAERPDAVAIINENACLSYGELNRRADRLAHHLRLLGVGPETIVAILLERSVEFVISILATLKAGGAYLPLDPEYPGERLARMLEDASARFILTDRTLHEAIPKSEARVVEIDTFTGADAARPADESQLQRTVAAEPRLPAKSKDAVSDARPVDITPDNIAYVMYTSGSTGVPKGTDIRHSGIMRLVFGAGYADLDEEQTMLQLASPSFDASTFELWGSLLHGGRCVLAPERIPTPSRLGDTIRRNNVTTLWLTSSLFNAVIDAAPETLSPLRQLLVGGEALSVRHIRRALDALPDTTITNGYGPTEATTFTCCYRIPRTLDPETVSVPIGRPIANTKVYILDQRMAPVPVGAPGELEIAGPGLARGYRNRPALTAERFVPDPFGDGERIYRTGDLVRYLPDGTIQFIGRLDEQLKIRGFRVEPEEIELVLADHPEVKAAVVAARDGTAGDKRLAAYIVPAQSKQPTSRELRSFLESKLPSYMIPDDFVPLAKIPLTSSGKIDRRSLPDPERIRPEEEIVYVPPRDRLEQTLAEIWKEVLKVDRVGTDDNFFDLGGNSILAIKTLNKIKDRCGYDIPVVDIFQYPRIGALAGYMRQEPDEDEAETESIDERVDRQREAMMIYRTSRQNVTDGREDEE